MKERETLKKTLKRQLIISEESNEIDGNQGTSRDSGKERALGRKKMGWISDLLN